MQNYYLDSKILPPEHLLNKKQNLKNMCKLHMLPLFSCAILKNLKLLIRG